MAKDPATLQLVSNVIVFLGVIVAVITITYNVRMAKKTQTAAFLFESRKNKDYVDSLHILKKAHESGKSFRSYVFPIAGTIISDEEMDERRKFQYILNFYERVAVSIRQGIYNEEMIKRTSWTTVIETWDIAEPPDTRHQREDKFKHDLPGI